MELTTAQLARKLVLADIAPIWVRVEPVAVVNGHPAHNSRDSLSMRPYSARTKRRPFRPWTASIQCFRFHPAGPNDMDSNATATGKLSSYAALEVKTGKIQGKTTKRHTSNDFIAFVTELVNRARWAKEVHIVPDNLSAHKAVEQFLADQSNSGSISLPRDSPLSVIPLA